MNNFLPVNRNDMKDRGWEQCDFVYISGDAYIDHPSFGAAIITRTLEAHGYKVGIIPQPNWRSVEDFKRLGKPRLGFLVSSGNIDSMVNHYTVSKHRRKIDEYTPNAEAGKRPDRATIVYSQMCRQAYNDVPILIGGIEASLRRMAHYDYWDNKVRKSIIIDANADLLMYGMGENCVVEVADALNSGLDVKDITFIDGTVYKCKNIDHVVDYEMLPSYGEIIRDKMIFNESYAKQYVNTDHFQAKRLIEPYTGWYVVQNIPNRPLTTSEMDRTYSLKYERTYHPMYKEIGHIPAINEVKFSIIQNRGCFGSCNFCALTFHQGRIIQSRSKKSLIQETKMIVNEPDFKGYIHDVGGPTANFRKPACKKAGKFGACKHKQCLWPEPCDQLEVDHSEYLDILREMRSISGVKKVFVRSGLRYDYLMYDKNDEFFEELVQYHVSGQLKVAPEHVSKRVLNTLGKPTRELYDKFVDKYYKINKKFNKNQFLVPYLMSSHPGSELDDAIELAEYLRDIGHQPEQVQDFYPTPGTLSTAMFYTGYHPLTKEKIYVAKSQKEKAMQRALIQYKAPRNYDLVYEALSAANRTDLIGYGSKCLIRPKTTKVYKKFDKSKREGYKLKGNKKYNNSSKVTNKVENVSLGSKDISDSNQKYQSKKNAKKFDKSKSTTNGYKKNNKGKKQVGSLKKLDNDRVNQTDSSEKEARSYDRNAKSPSKRYEKSKSTTNGYKKFNKEKKQVGSLKKSSSDRVNQSSSGREARSYDRNRKSPNKKITK